MPLSDDRAKDRYEKRITYFLSGLYVEMSNRAIFSNLTSIVYDTVTDEHRWRFGGCCKGLPFYIEFTIVNGEVHEDKAGLNFCYEVFVDDGSLCLLSFYPFNYTENWLAQTKAELEARFNLIIENGSASLVCEELEKWSNENSTCKSE